MNSCMLVSLRRECDLSSDKGIVKYGTDRQLLCMLKRVFSIWFDGDVFNHENYVKVVVVYLWRVAVLSLTGRYLDGMWQVGKWDMTWKTMLEGNGRGGIWSGILTSAWRD
jgi:hypothetical protein